MNHNPDALHEESPPSDDRLLFATDGGWVRHCACRDVLVLHFAGHWMALTRPQYRDFHARLIAAVRCPVGQRQLNTGGRFAFRSGDREPAFTLDLAGMEELLWLLDSARFMLEARDAARRGYRLGAGGRDAREAARDGARGEPRET
jgi:hypothetical protein